MRDKTAFIEHHGWTNPIAGEQMGDASARQYQRFYCDKGSVLLMTGETADGVALFAQIADHLHLIGVHSPIIYGSAPEQGWMLLEDFGDLRFSVALQQGMDEVTLYQQAYEALRQLQQHPKATKIALPPYDEAAFMQEAMLYYDWYLPYCAADLSESWRQDYSACWQEVWLWREQNLASHIPKTLVHRDYHVDNLMYVHQKAGGWITGILDFQDALIGSPCYDLISLIEDARRTVNQSVSDQIVTEFINDYPTLDKDLLKLECAIWAAQRHAKVCGIFVRLAKRDGKPNYLRHLPHVFHLLQRSIHRAPCLEGLSKFLKS